MAKPEAPSLEKLSMIDTHGERRYIFPAEVRGRFNRAKPYVYGLLIVLYIGLPFIQVGGKFPRLTSKSTSARLKEIRRLLMAL